MKAAFLLVLALFCLTAVHTTDRELQSATGFSYTNSGSDWGGTCTSGSNQSPVDLETTSGTCDSTMVFDISFPGSMTAVFNKTSNGNLKGWATSNNFATLFATDIDGVLTGYTSTTAFFHAPSEHTIEGNSYDLEVQFHCAINTDFASKAATSYTTAIVSILFSVSSSASSHPFIDALTLSSLNSAQTISLQTVLGAKLPSPVPYYTYHGSFTTPACSETVNWYVVSEPQYITSSQLTTFTNYWASNSTFAGGKGNNRPIQSTNSRTIKKGGVECEEQFVYFFSFFILYIFINYFIFKLL